MKRHPRTIVALLTMVFACTSALGANLDYQLEILRADLAKSTSPPANASFDKHAALQLLNKSIADISSTHAQWKAAELPPQRTMPRGQVGTIPSALAYLHLNSIKGKFNVNAPRATFPPTVLVISAGRLTLNELLEETEKKVPGALVRGPNGVSIKMPLLIWSDAELNLTKGDKIVLSGDTQSFIINLGLLRMNKATIHFLSSQGNITHPFYPFIATVSGGAMQARNSEFAGVGPEEMPVGAAVILSNSLLSIRQDKNILEGNTFKKLGSLSLLRTSDMQIAGNTFQESVGPDAIRIGAKSANVILRNNIILSGAGVGIRVERGANNLLVHDNHISDQSTDGIAIDEGACVSVLRNVVTGNAGNGIRISRSLNIKVEANRFLQNVGAGVFLQMQPKHSVTALDANTFVENAIGIRGLAAGQIEVANNNMTAQLPVVVSGDFPDALNALLVGESNKQRTRFSATSWMSADDDVDTSVRCHNGG